MLDSITAWLDDAKRHWSRLEFARVVPPDGATPFQPEPDVDRVLIRYADGKIDVFASGFKRAQILDAHARNNTRPRYVSPPLPVNGGWSGPASALARAAVALEALRAALADATARLGEHATGFRAEVERYYADVEQARIDFDAEKQAAIEAEAAREADELRRVVAEEEHRLAMLAKAKELGVK
jgi:hypothetical protein